MRGRLMLGVLALALASGGPACASPSPTPANPGEVPAPRIWVESQPADAEAPAGDASAWSGVWAEHFPGRPFCQDRFTLTAASATITVRSTDCTDERPYTISNVRWDGQTLRFRAEPPGGGLILDYSVTLERPGQITGTANDTAITWSRIEPPG